MSRLRKTVVPFSWQTIIVSFTQGTAGSVNLASRLTNPRSYPITYSVVGTLPTGVTLSGSTVSYNGTGSAATNNVQFVATSGTYVAYSSPVAVNIVAGTPVNADPVWVTLAGLGSIVSGAPFSFTLTATDAEADLINFIHGAPPFGTITTQQQSGGTRSLTWSGTAPTVTTDTVYTFAVDADDTPPLGQVTGLTATAGPLVVSLSWTAVANATSYQVERSLTGTGSWSALVTQAGTTYQNTGLTAGTTYWYRVRAATATQAGEYSAARSATPTAGGQEADWAYRSTLPGTVFAHDFRTESEITQFATQTTRDAARTVWSSTGILGTGGGALNSRAYGTTLAADVSVTASGATDIWTVADASKLPDVASSGSCLILVGTTSSNGEMVRMTARNLATNQITVTRGQQGSPKAYPIGEKIGSDPSDNWHRPLCAIPGNLNGKGVDDIGITQGHSTARTNWVPGDAQNFPYGYWGAEQVNYPTWTDDRGNVWTNAFEGTEFYLQFRVKWSAERFAVDVDGKWFYIDAHQTGIQQIFGNFQGEGASVAVPVWRRSYGDSRAVAGNNFTTTSVETPGGDYTTCMVGDVRNPATCFNIVPDQWITFLVHLQPGFSNYRPRVSGLLAGNLLQLSAASQPEEDLVLVDASSLPDPATWGTYPLEIRGQALETGTITEIVKVLSKTGNTLRVMRNWWRNSGTNKTFAAGEDATYGPTNNAPLTHAASWLNDAHLCPYHDSYVTVRAAYEGETTYRTVFASPGLPFVYGREAAPGNYGDGFMQLPGYCFFKPESYMNAYLGSGSQGPPVYFDALYTQIILSRNFIPCPSA
jgi:hypothetical protein